MLTYLIAFPDTLVDIKRPGQRTFLHFLYADLFTILTPEYIGTSFDSNSIGGVFMWDGLISEQMTRPEYDNYIDKIEGIFTHNDLHHLLGFDSSFDDVLRIIQKFFQLKLKDRNIVIKDLRTK